MSAIVELSSVFKKSSVRYAYSERCLPLAYFGDRGNMAAVVVNTVKLGVILQYNSTYNRCQEPMRR